MPQQARVDAAALDALFAPHDSTSAPGYAVGVALRGIPLYRRGFGLASVELPVALSPTIRMRIGSTTKHFCALAIMLLAEDGRLSADDSPRRALDWLPDWAERITLRQLMAHTSGMRDSLDLILHSAGPGKSAAPDVQLRMIERYDSVDFQPGESWSYNNGGYQLLTAVVERVSGQAFGTFLRERIFEPAGLHDTLLRPLDTDLLPNSATLHVPNPDGGWSRGVFGTAIGGEGGIVSTVDDMLRWLRHMDAPVVGTPATWAAMRTPLTTHGYGLGLFSDTHRGLRTVHHAGTVVGGASQMLKVPDHGLDIAIMTNGRSSAELRGLVDRIAELCIPGLPPAPEAFAVEPALRGTFHAPRSGRVLALAEQDGKQAIDIGGAVIPLYRQQDGALFVDLPTTDLRIRPVVEDGVVTALDAVEFGAADRLERVRPPARPAAAALAGRYVDPAAGLSAAIGIAADGTVSLRLEGELGAADYTLQPLAPHLWRAEGSVVLPLTLFIETEADALLLTTGRTRRLRLRRAA